MARLNSSRSILALSLLFIPALVFAGAFYDKLNVDNIQIDLNTVSSTNTNGDIILNPNGTGGVLFNDLTATTVPYLNADKEITSSAVTPTELGYLTGVTSAIQTQLNAKAPAASPTFSGTITTPLTASRAVVTGASSELAAATTTATEIGYVNGVTSAIQTQLDAKQSRSTLTTKGDLYVATGAGVVVRQAVGSDGTVLTADSTQTNGIKYASVASLNNLAVTSKTTTYTATTADDVILVDTSGGSWTLTLYTASGNTGKQLRIKKTTTDTNILTIDGNSTETIDGATTTPITGRNEEIIIVSDGTNWHILSDNRSVSAAYTTNASQSISTGSVTIIDFEDVSWDSHGAVTTGGSWKFTAPISGEYEVTAHIVFAQNAGWAVHEAAELRVYKNGAQHRTVHFYDSPAAASYSVSLAGSTKVKLAATDYIDVRVNQSSGGSIALTNSSEYQWISVSRVGNY